MKLTFAISSWQKDADLAPKAIESLKKAYPDAVIVHCVDVPPNRIKLPQFAGAWTERWMKAALETAADIIVKVDPDTRAYVRATEFPKEDIFGQVSDPGTYWHIEGVIFGAAIGFQRSAVEKIVASGLLNDKKYTVHPYLFDREEDTTVSLQDPIVHDIGLRLQLSSGKWTGLQMHTRWGDPVRDAEKYTFVHPVRE